ncbi:DUF1797 family protein [Furfurilactobacillus cerevisiae]|uniref:DUF1797 family protein n=1 Tax=Furfurilactobacillus rossiae TaxID=231049 RepID=UPI003B97F6EC
MSEETSTLLESIIRRLRAMQFDHRSEEQTRYFEQFGVEVCKVTLNQTTGEWTVQDARTAPAFCYDNMDMVAVAVYDALTEFKAVF